jgi:flagellar biosynthetic protein FliP
MTLGSLKRWAIVASLILGLADHAAAAQASTNTNPSTATTSSAPTTAAPAGAGNAGPTTSEKTAAATTPAQAKPGQPSGPTIRPSGVRNQLNPSSLPPIPGGGLQLQGVPGGSVPWSIVILLTGLTLIPSLLLCVTPFARLLIVFHFLRQALGLQTTPSNQTLIGLSLILTFFLMQPVGTQIYRDAVVPMEAGQITASDALQRGEAPMRKFMSHYVREKDVALFVDLAKEPRPASIDDVSLRVLLPAYILSELKAGFQIGTVLFLPFLIVDMVVASITTSVGMLQLPPVVISTPLKLLLFLMVDGWHLLIGSLMRSFN